MTTTAEDTFRRRLLDGMATSIEQNGYHNTTIADIVRHARTSRRTFYEHFASREECFAALFVEANAEMIRRITAAVDPKAPWQDQIRTAVEAWIACAESAPTITLSWIRDLPALGTVTRPLLRGMMDAFVEMVLKLCDTEELRVAGIRPVTREEAIILLGGLRELFASTLEDGGKPTDITEVAVRSAIALLGQQIH
ncbi:TetR family transcriptional regulator [Actinosynnema sp. ALI-1.44]|uniref:TetR/AcrR family transcriptional regulator n=1 Tax=Actinosynnema sp. ALI-1.44 TaxID=1933779 RepID=UPI00097C4E98|nr:TetR/AcrR family transcriptional regulator [Actinosynnema sp. ALI-1.44]ONI82896.1 TetR family transcriptional regulator [Actinosynnema sp. ALI-1.44]